MIRRFGCLFVLAVMLFPSGLLNRKVVEFIIPSAFMSLLTGHDDTDHRVQRRDYWG